ncbi:hypothetical protein U2F26_28115 [Micromonospora sp. 4G57]|uniref:Uncharacterized protein n=1 Tax=Micromonospora sicca TaxID=2202420 RepID=A0ABU5JNY9_9ACTN|nr:hypothetical protein [Micromonospora sp. 4G57]MDZ5446542.1 hypothetical protein [Micromonospora sp. 4G57]MDZ5494251.1 hypothetical protein [Micromonospora sp. 4G53]
MEHHLLKLELATAVRAADWHAELEVRSPDGIAAAADRKPHGVVRSRLQRR